MTTVADGLYQYGGMPVTPGIPVPFTGNWWFVDGYAGADGNSGRKPDDAFKTIYAAKAHVTAGNNDVVAIIANGSTNSTARLSLANALLFDPTATSGQLVWDMAATHLIGICSPASYSQRARLAPETADTVTGFGSALMVSVTASGCYFSNFQAYNGFATGGANQICWRDNGSRNVYNGVHFAGIADTGSANSAGSRSLKIGAAGSGENVFYRCTIGVDTVARTAANASLELAGSNSVGTPRNRFTECIFPSWLTGSGSGAFAIIGTGNACVDRHNIFERCIFANAIKSDSGVASAAVLSFTTNAPGGYIIFKDCDTIGYTKMGDTNGLANSFVTNLYGTGTSGLDVAPS